MVKTDSTLCETRTDPFMKKRRYEIMLLCAWTLIVYQIQTVRGWADDSIVWGESTNGISAGVAVRDASQGISVYVRRQGDVLLVEKFVGNHSPTNYYQEAPLYLAATNLFCGPVELSNAAGKKIGMLKPSVSSPDSYPAYLSYRHLYESELRRHDFHFIIPGDRGRAFLSDTNEEFLMSIEPNDYFKVEKPGKYQLTIWPKICKRSDQNIDSYKRIDIPPVKVTIELNGKN